MVYEVVPSKKLDSERVLNLKIRHNDWYIVKTVFERKNSGRVAINSSIILFVDIGLVFHNIKCPNYEQVGPPIPNGYASIMDRTQTLQHRPRIAANNSVNVHKEIIQIILQRLPKIHKHFPVSNTHQQNSSIHCRKVLRYPDQLNTILEIFERNKIWVIRKNDRTVQERSWRILFTWWNLIPLNFRSQVCC